MKKSILFVTLGMVIILCGCGSAPDFNHAKCYSAETVVFEGNISDFHRWDSTVWTFVTTEGEKVFVSGNCVLTKEEQ